jgi:hypothetical protein
MAQQPVPMRSRIRSQSWLRSLCHTVRVCVLRGWVSLWLCMLCLYVHAYARKAAWGLYVLRSWVSLWLCMLCLYVHAHACKAYWGLHVRVCACVMRLSEPMTLHLVPGWVGSDAVDEVQISRRFVPIFAGLELSARKDVAKTSKPRKCWREAEMCQVDERRHKFPARFTQTVGITLLNRLNVRSILKRVWTARLF